MGAAARRAAVAARGARGPARRLLLSLGVAGWLAGAGPAARAGDAAPQSWEQRLAALVRDPRLGGARVGLLAIDLGSGRTLAQLDPDQPLLVASTVKLLTAAAALQTLGPDFRFRTELHGPPLQGGTLPGDLVLKGHGDPSLDEADLWRLARRLIDLGLRQVRGALRLDESYFDGQRLPPLYETRDTDADYRPATGALALHDNTVTVWLRPTEPGLPAAVTLIPRSSYLRLAGSVLTVQPPARTAVELTTEGTAGQTIVRLRGTLRAGGRGLWQRRRIEDPGLFAGLTLRDLLEQQGVRFSRRRVRRGSVPVKARLLLTHRSVPLVELVRQMNKRSSNLIAEQLVRTLGAETAGPPGSFSNGLAVIERFLAASGLRPGSYQLKNGSGLYESARFSPRQIVAALAQAWRDFRSGPELVSSLAIAGADGTLAHRFAGSAAARFVRGKTGTLANVVALSGFAGVAGRAAPLAFAIIFNALPNDRLRAARRVADELAETLLGALHASSAAQIR